MKHGFNLILLASIVALLTPSLVGAAIPEATATPATPTSLPATWDNAVAKQLEQHLSGSLDLLSNYVWRGVSQTQNAPAVQGSITYTFDTGFYLNVAGSNVNFTDQNGDNATVELDWVAGYSHQFDNGIGYGLFAQRYSYPKASGSDYNEYFFNLAYGIFTATASYSDSVFATGKSGEYYTIGADYEVPAEYVLGLTGVALGGSVGYSRLPVEAGPSYSDYSVSLGKSLSKTVKVTMTYSNTSHSLNEGPHVTADLSVNFS